MPQLDTDFPITEPNSNGIYSIDFAKVVPTGGSISGTPTWSISVDFTMPNATVDSTPSLRLSGSPTVSGNTTSQTIVNLVDGNNYLVECSATMNDGEIVVLWTHIPCRAGG